MPELRIHRLGRVEYADGLELQRQFAEARRLEKVPDTLLLLEHPPVLTLGRGAKPGNVVASREQLQQLGVDVFETSRGGDVTYHGPGQIVGYPIFLLPEGRRDVRRYVRDVEETMIRSVAKFGLAAARIPRWPGVWLGEEGAADARKIAAIGVHISRWLTTHGFALNVNTNLSHFELIVPCGIKEAGVTSMQRELGRPLPLSQVEDALVEAYAAVFGGTPAEAEPSMRTVSVVPLANVDGRQKLLLLKRTHARGGFWQIVTGRIEAGESALSAASRELEEETGAPASALWSLDYAHSFALGDEAPPRVVHETAFAAELRDAATVRLDPREHDEAEWVDVETALQRLPFEGLKRAVQLARRPRPS